ncbi:hypothetical protein ACP4OV_013088 [Aristida adscensionis]
MPGSSALWAARLLPEPTQPEARTYAPRRGGVSLARRTATPRVSLAAVRTALEEAVYEVVLCRGGAAAARGGGARPRGRPSASRAPAPGTGTRAGRRHAGGRRADGGGGRCRTTRFGEEGCGLPGGLPTCARTGSGSSGAAARCSAPVRRGLPGRI